MHGKISRCIKLKFTQKYCLCIYIYLVHIHTRSRTHILLIYYIRVCLCVRKTLYPWNYLSGERFLKHFSDFVEILNFQISLLYLVFSHLYSFCLETSRRWCLVLRTYIVLKYHGGHCTHHHRSSSSSTSSLLESMLRSVGTRSFILSIITSTM